MPWGCDMLGIRRTETPEATTMKIGFMGDVPYVIDVVPFCRFRFTGVCVAGPRKVAFREYNYSVVGLTTLLTATA